MTQNTSETPDQPGKWIVSKFGDPSVLQWQSLAIDREMASDEVLVRIITAGIAGVDNIQRAGGYPDANTSKPGFTPGYDFVGEVIKLGPSAAKHLTVGDLVTSMCMVGAHATHIFAPSSELIRLEPTDDPVLVCALPLNYMTAWGMLKRTGVDLQPGSSILIGSVSGGVGTAVAQLVRAFKLDITMFGTCSPSKMDYVRSLGVVPINRHAPDLVDQVRALTNGEGVDVAYDAAGGQDSLMKSHQATKAGTGQVVTIGAMDEIQQDGSGMRLKTEEIVANLEARLPPRSSFFSVVWHYSKKMREEFISDFKAILGKVRTGELVPEVFGLYRLSEAVQVHHELINGRNVKGKMVFVVDAALAAKSGL